MVKTIVQKVVFRNTTSKALYDLYMNAKKHTHISGAPAKITNKEGEAFSAHGGYINGKNIHLVKDKLIVQSWRGADWAKSEADSTFIISLEQKGKNVSLTAVHANIPAKHVAGIEKGWFAHYWNPWQQYIAGKSITRPAM